MNFNAVRQAMGQKDPQKPQYDLKVTMFATFTNIEGITFTKNQKQTCTVKLQDDAGESHNTHLYGTLPTAAMNGLRAEFQLSAFSGQGQAGQYTGYSGFWNDRSQVNQGQAATQQAPAPVPNAYAGPSPTPSPAASVVAPQPVHVPVGRDATGVSIERQCVVKAVCEVAARRSPMDVGEIIKWCVILHKWVTDGQDIPTMGQQPGQAPFAPPLEFDPGTPDESESPF